MDNEAGYDRGSEVSKNADELVGELVDALEDIGRFLSRLLMLASAGKGGANVYM